MSNLLEQLAAVAAEARRVEAEAAEARQAAFQATIDGLADLERQAAERRAQ